MKIIIYILMYETPEAFSAVLTFVMTSLVYFLRSKGCLDVFAHVILSRYMLNMFSLKITSNPPINNIEVLIAVYTHLLPSGDG